MHCRRSFGIRTSYENETIGAEETRTAVDAILNGDSAEVGSESTSRARHSLKSAQRAVEARRTLKESKKISWCTNALNGSTVADVLQTYPAGQGRHALGTAMERFGW